MAEKLPEKDKASIFTYGCPIEEAKGALVLVHGRGAAAQSMLALVEVIEQALQNGPHKGKMTYLLPQAYNYTWYPNTFLAILDQNEPYLSQSLGTLGEVLAMLAAAGIPASRAVLAGFSQGACLALEYAVRNAQRYGGVVGLSGGLIGPPGRRWNYPGSFDGTPVFLGCSESDPHISKDRVQQSDEVLRGMGAQVETHLYEGLGHTINADELTKLTFIIQAMLAS